MKAVILAGGLGSRLAEETVAPIEGATQGAETLGMAPKATSNPTSPYGALRIRTTTG